MLIMCYFI